MKIRDGRTYKEQVKIILLAVFYSTCLIFYGGLAFKLGWDWFVVPTTNFPNIQYFNAVGLAFCISIIHTIIADTRVRPSDTPSTTAGTGLLIVRPIADDNIPPMLSLTLQFIGLISGSTLSIGFMAIIHFIATAAA